MVLGAVLMAATMRTLSGSALLQAPSIAPESKPAVSAASTASNAAPALAATSQEGSTPVMALAAPQYLPVQSLPVLPVPLLDHGLAASQASSARRAGAASAVRLPAEKLAREREADDEASGSGVHVQLRHTGPKAEARGDKLQDEPPAPSEVLKQAGDLQRLQAKQERPAVRLQPSASESLAAAPRYTVIGEYNGGAVIRMGNQVRYVEAGDRLPDGQSLDRPAAGSAASRP